MQNATVQQSIIVLAVVVIVVVIGVVTFNSNGLHDVEVSLHLNPD